MGATPFHHTLVYVSFAATAEAYILKTALPDLEINVKITTAIGYLFLPNLLAYLLLRWYVFPQRFSPYRNLPGPRVRHDDPQTGREQY